MHNYAQVPCDLGTKIRLQLNTEGAGEISGNIQLPGKLFPFQRVFHRFWPCEKCPVHRVWDFQPHEKHCKSSEVFHRVFDRFFHRLKTHVVFHRVLHRFWPCETCPFHRFWHFLPCEKHCESSQVFHRVFHRVLHGFWPCENCPFHRVSTLSHPVKKVWKACEKTCEIEQFTCFFTGYFTGFSQHFHRFSSNSV